MANQEGRLPANAVGVAWLTRREPTDENLAQRFTVEIHEEGRFHLLPTRTTPVEGFRGLYVIGPKDGSLEAGATYRITDNITHSVGETVTQVVVTVDHGSLPASESLDLEVGPIANETITVAANASCSAELDVSQVTIEARLPRGAQKWREQLLFRTIVDDGIKWVAFRHLCSLYIPGRSWEMIGKDRLFVPCEKTARQTGRRFGQDVESPREWVWNDYLLLPGRHTLRMQVVLPGTDVVLETEPETVNLSCS